MLLVGCTSPDIALLYQMIWDPCVLFHWNGVLFHWNPKWKFTTVITAEGRIEDAIKKSFLSIDEDMLNGIHIFVKLITCTNSWNKKEIMTLIREGVYISDQYKIMLTYLNFKQPRTQGLIKTFHKPFTTFASVLYRIYKLSPKFDLSLYIRYNTAHSCCK